MSEKLRKAEFRAAFYKAAANIEANPESYTFFSDYVGGAGKPACMWGHVGRAIKMDPDTTNIEVARFFGCEEGELYSDGFYHPASHLQLAPLNDKAVSFKIAERLRAFADYKWSPES